MHETSEPVLISPSAMLAKVPWRHFLHVYRFIILELLQALLPSRTIDVPQDSQFILNYQLHWKFPGQKLRNDFKASLKGQDARAGQ